MQKKEATGEREEEAQKRKVEPHRSPVEQDELQELQLESSSPTRLKPPNT